MLYYIWSVNIWKGEHFSKWRKKFEILQESSTLYFLKCSFTPGKYKDDIVKRWQSQVSRQIISENVASLHMLCTFTIHNTTQFVSQSIQKNKSEESSGWPVKLQ